MDDEPILTPAEIREVKLVEGLAAGQSLTDAAVGAGYANGNPRNAVKYAASEVMPRLRGNAADPDKSRHWRAILEKAGLTDEKVAEKLNSGMEAIQHGLTKDGLVVEMGPDWHARAKLLDLVLKVKDAYPNPRLDVAHNVTGAVVFTPADMLGVPLLFDGETVEGESRELPVEDG